MNLLMQRRHISRSATYGRTKGVGKIRPKWGHFTNVSIEFRYFFFFLVAVVVDFCFFYIICESNLSPARNLFRFPNIVQPSSDYLISKFWSNRVNPWIEFEKLAKRWAASPPADRKGSAKRRSSRCPVILICSNGDWSSKRPNSKFSNKIWL